MTNNRNKKIEFRVTAEEKKLIEEYANNLGMSTSRYARTIILLELDSILVKSGLDEKLIKAVLYIKKKFLDPTIEQRLKED